MRKSTVILIFLLAVATSAAAAVDPDPDGIGVYFDPAATTAELAVGPNVPFPAYVVLVNPTRSDLTGFEFHYRLDPVDGLAAQVVRLAVELPPGVICPSCFWDPLEDSVRLDWAAPLPTAETTVLMSWQYMLLSPLQLDFYLAATPFMGPDAGQLAYRSGGNWYPMAVSSGDPALPVAAVNGTVVGTETARLGQIKALYR